MLIMACVLCTRVCFIGHIILGLCFLEDPKYSSSSSISVAVKKSDDNILFPLISHCCFCLDAHCLSSLSFHFFFNVCLFLRDRERQSTSGEGAEREGDTESEAG